MKGKQRSKSVTPGEKSEGKSKKEEERKSRKDSDKKTATARSQVIPNQVPSIFQSKKAGNKSEKAAPEKGEEEQKNNRRRSLSTRSRGEPTQLDEDYYLVLKDIKYPKYKYVAFLDEDGLQFKIAKVISCAFMP